MTLSILAFFIVSLTDDGYATGRDTIKSFGNKRFQLIRHPFGLDNYQKISLYDAKEEKTIIQDVYNYKENDSFLYITAKDIYCILDYQVEIYRCSVALNDFTLEEQKKF